MWLRWLHRLERWVIYYTIRLFRIRSTTEHIARGFAIGLIVNFFPTFGLGMLISGFLAKAIGGSAIAGLVGGAALAFAWPVLFYLNLRTGSIFRQPSIVVEDFDDVTPKVMDTLMWGKTFTLGAILNSLLVGLAAYVTVLLLYHRIRPPVLAYFRRHARVHQCRFRQWKRRPVRV
ncbi:MAG: DUF2062 domain-containing protein [Verrucomicrobia bacterium]|nr:DUF2062 domain-containing protein [Verrucomicrobiota bacterium]